MRVERVVSGGQTGADRGALEAAQFDLGWAPGVQVGGYVPRGRRAEDGRVPACFVMEETPESTYGARTMLNALRSNATVLFCHGARTPGTKQTYRLCREMDRPVRVFNLQLAKRVTIANAVAAWVQSLEETVEDHGRTLNVAGTRESGAPGIQAAVREVMRRALPRINGVDT